MGEGDQLIGVLAARRQDGHHAVALARAMHDSAGGAFDALGVGHRGPAELHHQGLRAGSGHGAER